MKSGLTRDQRKTFLLALGVAALVINLLIANQFQRKADVRYIPRTELRPEPAEPTPAQTIRRPATPHFQEDQRAVMQVARFPAPSLQSEAELRRAREEEDRHRLQVEQRNAALAAEAAHKKYLAKYLANPDARKSSLPVLAIVAADENDRLNYDISQTLTESFRGNGIEIPRDVFTPDFVRDGLYSQVFEGSGDLLSKLGVRNTVDGLLLAKQTVRYSRSPELENVTTASMNLEIRLISLGDAFQDRTWTFEAAGAGFSNSAARQLAEERLLKKLNSQTKMTLSSIRR